jgi:hypothetical protein
VQTRIADFAEVDVFYPDGLYRRRLSVRGLASDPNWDTQSTPSLWGTWQRQGNKIIASQGTSITYTIQDSHT